MVPVHPVIGVVGVLMFTTATSGDVVRTLPDTPPTGSWPERNTSSSLVRVTVNEGLVAVRGFPLELRSLVSVATISSVWVALALIMQFWK